MLFTILSNRKVWRFTREALACTSHSNPHAAVLFTRGIVFQTLLGQVHYPGFSGMGVNYHLQGRIPPSHQSDFRSIVNSLAMLHEFCKVKVHPVRMGG